MKKKLLNFCIILVAVFVITKICKSNTEKKDSMLLKEICIKNDTNTTSLSFLNNNSHKVNYNVFGINVGFSFAKPLNEDTNFCNLLNQLQPNILRFPGGTVASFYHPNGNGYGFVKEESEQLPSIHILYKTKDIYKQNILYNFIDLCKKTNAKAIFCANLLTGNPAEAIFVLDEFKKNNIEVVGIELGNEFNGFSYRKQFPNATIYIDKCKQFATQIEKKYPNLPIGVIAADAIDGQPISDRDKFMYDWNTKLAEDTSYFDAIIVHPYTNFVKEEKANNFDEIFINSTKNIFVKTNDIEKIYQRYQYFFPTKKIWLTEWNLVSPFLENTYTQGAFVYNYFLKLIAVNSKNNNPIAITNLHSLGPFGMGIFTALKGKTTSFSNNKNEYVTSVFYYSYLFLTNTILKNNCTQLETQIQDSTFRCYTFLSVDKKKIFVHYIHTNNEYKKLNVQNLKYKNIHQKYISGEYPYSSCGQTSFTKKYPTKIEQLQIKEENNISKIIIQPYSFGYVEINL